MEYQKKLKKSDVEDESMELDDRAGNGKAAGIKKDRSILAGA